MIPAILTAAIIFLVIGIMICEILLSYENRNLTDEYNELLHVNQELQKTIGQHIAFTRRLEEQLDRATYSNSKTTDPATTILPPQE